MVKNYDWLVKKTPRSVDQLRLWPENPRLNPDEIHLTLSDFAEDLTSEDADKKDFFELITSIVNDGFIPADPIVVWKNNENNKYYVAEGNRRLVALKLLRDPHKAPKSIRSFIRKASSKINTSEIEKIPVNVAPTFEDAEWYINQRNSASSLQRRWTRVQQQRWIVTLYEKYNGDIEKIVSITKLSKSELEGFFRILKIKDFVKEEEVKNKLSEEEFELANSYKFPITILERFFSFSDVRLNWGIEYDGIDVKIISDRNSFFNAFTELIKRIVGDNNEDKINTRLTKENLNEVLDSLPKVIFSTEKDEVNLKNISENESAEISENVQESSVSNDNTSNQNTKNIIIKNDPNRRNLVLPIYNINTSSYRLAGLFNEFKRISLTYKNTVSASLRVFLDLAVLNYIESEGIENAIKSHYRDDLKNISLKKRLEYIKTNHLSGKPQIIVSKLIDPVNQYSLDVLNGFVHGQDTYNLNKQFLNSFWDFLFPLFEILLDIKEK